MTKASDNAYPSILVTEGTAPASPAAGKQRLYIDSTTHKLKRVNSSGTTTDIEGGAAGALATDTTWAAAGDLIVGTGNDAASILSIGASGKVPTSNGTTLAYSFPPGYELDYVQFTSPVTVTATGSNDAGTDLVVSGSSVAYDGSTVVMVEFYAPGCETPASASNILLYLYDGTTSLGIISQLTAETATLRSPIHVTRRLTPSNASHTYKIKAAVATGTGSVKAGAGGTGVTYLPGYIRITKV